MVCLIDKSLSNMCVVLRPGP